METILNLYGPAIASFGAIGVLLLVQVSVADILGLVSGHTPGTSVEESHANPLFRAARAHANTNETLGVFVVLVIFSISVAANPHWVNCLSLGYIGARICHMGFYYANIQLLRSLSFAVSLIALFGLAIVGWQHWLRM